MSSWSVLSCDVVKSCDWLLISFSPKPRGLPLVWWCAPVTCKDADSGSDPCCTRAAESSINFNAFPSTPIWWDFVVDCRCYPPRKSACTIILSRKPSNACALEHLCKIRVVMVLGFFEVSRTLMQASGLSIKLEEISTTISNITTITTMPWMTKWWYVNPTSELIRSLLNFVLDKLMVRIPVCNVNCYGFLSTFTTTRIG